MAGRPVGAARVALGLGNDERARALLYEAVQNTDTGIARAAVRVAIDRFPARDAKELARVVGVLRGFDQRRATTMLRDAVARGDSTPRIVRLLGDLEAVLGRPVAALAAYESLSSASGSEANRAKYRRARLLLRIGRTTQGYAALEAFARAHQQSAEAPVAAYLVAERALRRASRPVAHSLLEWVATTWPNHAYGSRSRIQLAALELRSRDTTAALEWYRREIALGGEQRFAARCFAAQTQRQMGDANGAQSHLVQLATQDSLGYYGTVARELAGLEGVRVAEAHLPDLGPRLTDAFAKLDLLREVGFEAEARMLVGYLIDHTHTPEELLELAEGLSSRGWVVEGIRLGWRVAAQRSLHEPRVLRVIYPYPWPVRTLIENEAIEHGVDPYLLAAVVRQESAFRETVTSRAGARGLMQLMPSTAVQVARQLGVEWDEEWLTVGDANLHLGSAHLAALLRQYRSVAPALAAYNAGGTPVARWLRYPDASDPYRFIEQIPWVETRGYVRAVVRNHSLYRALYPPATGATIDQP